MTFYRIHRADEAPETVLDPRRPDGCSRERPGSPPPARKTRAISRGWEEKSKK